MPDPIDPPDAEHADRAKLADYHLTRCRREALSALSYALGTDAGTDAAVIVAAIDKLIHEIRRHGLTDEPTLVHADAADLRW